MLWKVSAPKCLLSLMNALENSVTGKESGQIQSLKTALGVSYMKTRKRNKIFVFGYFV